LREPLSRQESRISGRLFVFLACCPEQISGGVVMNFILNEPIYIYLPIEHFRDLCHLTYVVIVQFPGVLLLLVTGGAVLLITLYLIGVTMLSAALAEQKQD
jgi:hypothetical protein